MTETFSPIAIGLTSRNAGDIGFLGGERRVGMTVFDWNALTTVTHDRGAGKTLGQHARVFVAKGTHGLYPAPASPGTGFSQEVPFFAPDDSASRYCGAAELLDKSLEDLQDEAEDAADDTWVDDSEVFWTKVGVLGFIWAGLEWIAGGGGGINSVASKTPPQFDHPRCATFPVFSGRSCILRALCRRRVSRPRSSSRGSLLSPTNPRCGPWWEATSIRCESIGSVPIHCSAKCGGRAFRAPSASPGAGAPGLHAIPRPVALE